jgi:hypothetical protein
MAKPYLQKLHEISLMRSHAGAVIASDAKQSNPLVAFLDCFVASLLAMTGLPMGHDPRDLVLRLLTSPRKLPGANAGHACFANRPRAYFDLPPRIPRNMAWPIFVPAVRAAD